MWKKKEGTWGSGNISRAPTHPLAASRSSPAPRVGKITTHPGLRGRGEPGASAGKQMSPLAAASASGERCAGALPRTFTSHFSGIPLTTASPRRGCFFQTQRFACAAFLPGSCSYPATLSRCQDAAPARLSRQRQRERPGGCPLHLQRQPAPPLPRRKEPVLQAASRVAQEGFCPPEAGSPRTQKKTRVPHSYSTRGGCGKRVKRGQPYTAIGVTFWAISLGCQ